MRSVATSVARRSVIALGNLSHGNKRQLITQRYSATATATTSLSANDLHRYQSDEKQQGRQQLCAFTTTASPNPIFYYTEKESDKKFSYCNNHSLIQSRYYVSATPPKSRSGAALVLGLGTIAATAKAGQYAVQAYNEWKESQPSPEEAAAEEQKKEREETMNASSGDGGDGGDTTSSTKGEANEGKRENIFAKMFNLNVGSKYYEGGFDDKMTRREAALILGVRESSTAKRIKDAHRKLLILNHPDTGGSTYLAGKLNEAKDLLLKGKSM